MVNPTSSFLSIIWRGVTFPIWPAWAHESDGEEGGDRHHQPSSGAGICGSWWPALVNCDILPSSQAQFAVESC
ncbi:hypothetical protein V8C37DRAFT_376670 [Trichoderma ceciliae]